MTQSDPNAFHASVFLKTTSESHLHHKWKMEGTLSAGKPRCRFSCHIHEPGGFDIWLAAQGEHNLISNPVLPSTDPVCATEVLYLNLVAAVPTDFGSLP